MCTLHNAFAALDNARGARITYIPWGNCEALRGLKEIQDGLEHFHANVPHPTQIAVEDRIRGAYGEYIRAYAGHLKEVDDAMFEMLYARDFNFEEF